MVHRLLCCSDTHGEVPPDADVPGVVARLHAGDLIDGPTALGDDSDPADDPLRSAASAWFTSTGVQTFVVRGNHDVADDLRAFEGGRDLTGRVARVADRLIVAGVGWHGERHFELPLESDLRPACESVRRQARRLVMPGDRVILLTHYPPRLAMFRDVPGDSPEAGVWFDCVRELAEDLRPVAVVQGHVHHWFGTSHRLPLGGVDALVLSPGPSGAELMIDTETGSADHRWLPPNDSRTSATRA